MRSAPSSSFFGSFRAAKTWLGLPLWQAEPEERQMPRSLRKRTTTSLLYPVRVTGRMCGAPPSVSTRSWGTRAVSCSWA